MRIDYSEPKQAYVAQQTKLRPRKEPPVRLISVITIVTGVITFVAGFGSGWFFAQRATKKAFQAAITQTSLENSPKPPSPPPKVQPPVEGLQQPQPNPANQQTTPVPAAGQNNEPLSFYKTLPSGQKGNVIGSGINTKDDKGKQPLQAAIPSNLNKPSTQAVENNKQPGDRPQPSPEKPAARQENSGFTVQVASYTLKSEAETLKHKLTGKGYNVTIIESNQGDKGTWYRVRIGRKLEQEAAKELAGKIGKGALAIPDRD
ncbi:MAG TPA: SPOR domain-containing protein [Desulfuromonadaceae bacterium]|jgi:cell division septation protein DedD